MSRIARSILQLREQQQQDKTARQTSQNPPKPAKKKSGILAPEREKIVQMRISGKSSRQISRETGRDRDTINKIVKEADLPAYVEKLREKFHGMGEIALACVKRKLAKNPEFAYKFLTDIGVISRGDSIPILPPVVNPLASPEPMSDVVRDQLLAAMPERDRLKFRLLKMAEVRAEAYGLSPDEIDFTKDEEQEPKPSEIERVSFNSR